MLYILNLSLICLDNLFVNIFLLEKLRKVCRKPYISVDYVNSYINFFLFYWFYIDLCYRLYLFNF